MGNFLRTYSGKSSHSNKAKYFRESMKNTPVRLIGAHNGLTARIAENAGFDAIWASSFEISASFGLPDASLISMDKYVQVVKDINDAVDIPVIADCDSGFGNVINTIKMAYDMERAGVAGLCIEDNLFPKKCSFYEGKRELATKEEHAKRIEAIKKQVTNPDFFVIARTEALIAGHGEEEAFVRALVYQQAGADAILIHSKASTPEEVVNFAQAWDGEIPLVCVPTTYGSLSANELHSYGFDIVIFANHGLRASTKAMKSVLKKLNRTEKIEDITINIDPLNEIFEIVDQPIYKTIESAK